MHYNEYECTPLNNYEFSHTAIRQIKNDEKMRLRDFTPSTIKNEIKIRLGAQFTVVATILAAAGATSSFIR